jgi:hypothetical protein
MRVVRISGIVFLLCTDAYSQQITTGEVTSVPSNGHFGGQNASVWKAECPKGTVMTGVEIVVGGSCHNQCSTDGRPLTTYGIHCTELHAEPSAK